MIMVPLPRKHRKKRIRKKWHTKWKEDKDELVALSSLLAETVNPPGYRCVSCGLIKPQEER